jgi:SAM-dependent methyltransferase
VIASREPAVLRTEGNTPDFEYSGSELDALSEGQNYYRWIVGRFRPYFGKHVIEVGAGIGTFATHVLALPEIERFLALEPGVNTFPSLRQRLAGDSRADAVQAYLDQIGEMNADSLVAVNVLEHIKDDLGFLKDAYRVTAPSGHLLIYVPALPQIFGTLDVALEHHRRYTKRTLTAVIEGGGWKIDQIRYCNLPGVLAWYIVNRILRKTSLERGEVRLYDRLVIPVVTRVESFWSPPIGQNLLVVASKS